MIIKTNSISFKDTNLFSTLILDYLDKKSNLHSFIDTFYSIDEITKNINKKKFTSRDNLVKVLNEQYEKTFLFNGKSECVQNNIDLLLTPNSYTVTTGHQLSICVSPLFLIYKISSVIAHTRYLNRTMPEFSFVPFFWMATEDHDFDEINKMDLYGNNYVWNLKTQDAVGNLNTSSIKTLLNDLKVVFDMDMYGKELYDIFHYAYTKNSNYADATRSILNSLFGDYGLVVLDPNHLSFKKIFIQEFKSEIQNNNIFNNISNTNKIMSQYYKPQINALKSNIFYLSGSIRSKIEFKDEKYISLGHNKTWSKSELLHEIETSPERFSPNVFLRTLYQQSILPNILYLGGPSEIAYWLQLSQLFHATNKQLPVLGLRSFFLILSKKSSQFYQKNGLQEADLFLSHSNRVKKAIKNIMNFNIVDVENKMQTFLKDVEDHISHIDQFPINSFLVFKKNIAKEVAKLDSKIIKFEKGKRKDLTNRLLFLDKKIFSQNIPQERWASFIPYYIKYGKKFFDLLVEESLIFDNKYIILTEKD